jgi:subtilisin family serine protease
MARERQVWSLARTLSLAAALAWAPAATAQILGGGLPGLPGGGGLPGPLGDLPRVDPASRSTPRLPTPPALPSGITPLAGAVGDLASVPLSEVRRLTATRLLRDHPDVVEADDQGQPVVRGEVLAVGVTRDTLARLRQAGYSVRSQSSLGELGIEAFVLAVPRGQSAVQAIHRLRTLDPAGEYDFNHLYQEAGAANEAPGDSRPPITGADVRGLRIGLVDGSVAQSRPALARARLVQRAFAPGGAQVTPHATAVASLIAGDAGPFHGSAPGATLYVADVYGPTPTGGSAEAVAQGLAWLAQSNTPVIDISLVGPPNRLLEAAVRAVVGKGTLVVAAVGNDGPAAPPLYPAAYPGVVAVTAVDARGRVLPEAGRGAHVGFAAPGSDMAAAGVRGGYVSVRGTSFAAPIVAGRLAVLRIGGSSAQALEALGREAVDLGAPGPDPVYGRGLVGAEVRTDPAAVRGSH